MTDAKKHQLCPCELRAFISALIRVDQAGRLREFIAEACHRAATGGRDAEHATLGERLAVQTVAGEAAKLVDVSVDVCETAAEAALLPTRRRVILDTAREYVSNISQTAPPRPVVRIHRA